MFSGTFKDQTRELSSAFTIRKCTQLILPITFSFGETKETRKINLRPLMTSTLPNPSIYHQCSSCNKMCRKSNFPPHCVCSEGVSVSMRVRRLLLSQGQWRQHSWREACSSPGPSQGFYPCALRTVHCAVSGPPCLCLPGGHQLLHYHDSYQHRL